MKRFYLMLLCLIFVSCSTRVFRARTPDEQLKENFPTLILYKVPGIDNRIIGIDPINYMVFEIRLGVGEYTVIKITKLERI